VTVLLERRSSRPPMPVRRDPLADILLAAIRLAGPLSIKLGSSISLLFAIGGAGWTSRRSSPRRSSRARDEAAPLAPRVGAATAGAAYVVSSSLLASCRYGFRAVGA
jgi:hypothetical protein